MDVQCKSLEEVRKRIDQIDRAMVDLIAQRGGFVAQAAHFKKDSADVRAPARVEQVIGRVRALADEHGASAAVVEQVYRAMIAAFIEEELRTHAALSADA
ncbi:isochorismate pyruvate lyase [Pseudomonas sp. AG1028]|uniref:chorismate mutase n=1 Tax=Pseudomonas sp. AG1028 TaxID=2572911 RepID=UPI0011AC1CCA|nr:chorismate mutase [Pseudomonas sp. AG1028]TWE02276.1 isochorismate pyruvate lyase [Pseudomonas sp. AG1028]